MNELEQAMQKFKSLYEISDTREQHQEPNLQTWQTMKWTLAKTQFRTWDVLAPINVDIEPLTSKPIAL